MGKERVKMGMEGKKGNGRVKRGPRGYKRVKRE